MKETQWRVRAGGVIEVSARRDGEPDPLQLLRWSGKVEHSREIAEAVKGLPEPMESKL